MKPIQKLTLAALATSALLAAAGPASAAQMNVCVVHNNADHPSITAIVNGMNDEAARYEAQITYFDPAFDPQRQVSMIEDCVSRKPDVVVVNAVDPAAVVPALKAVSDAGIPVIMQNSDTNEEGMPTPPLTWAASHSTRGMRSER